MAKFCSSCGTQLAPAARFCAQCGATVPGANDDQEVVAVTSPPPTINQEARAATEQDKQRVSQQPSTVIDQSKGAQNKLIKSAGLAALVFLVGWGVFAALPQAEHQYDPKRLGFTDKAEMDAAFAKGYHTKQKLTEMTTYEIYRKNIFSEGWEILRLPPLSANWKPPFPEAAFCYEAGCTGYFNRKSNKSEARTVYFTYCDSPYGGDLKCEGKPRNFILVVDDKLMTTSDATKDYMEMKSRFDK
jgi:hypothetical protein